MRKDAIWVLLAGAGILLASYPAAGKKEVPKPNGAKLFAQYCSKCHIGGANIIKESHPIADSKQLASLPTFKAYLNAPPGHMPYYQQLVNNKENLESLYQYCKQLKPKAIKQACLR